MSEPLATKTPLHKRLRARRVALGWTQEETAKRANTYRVAVAQIELGERRHPRKEAALARVLGVRTSIDELFGLGEGP